MKYELQNLIQGKGRDGKTNIISTIASYLNGCKEASNNNKGKEYTKQQEEKSLIAYIEQNKFWFQGILSEYSRIGAGAEQIVYYNSEKGVVIKTNDSVFYSYWVDYLHSLILHNYFFPDTEYTLLGFRFTDDALYAVVQQPHIVNTELVDLDLVKVFLSHNGFVNTRRNDYYNEQLGIILEDLHDENVLSVNQIPFFVDTVFYLTENFYKD
jgi:hypothetical protein